jgi:hypothetical protein
MRSLSSLLLTALVLLVCGTVAHARTVTFLFGDRAIVITQGGTTITTCDPPSGRVCAIVFQGEGNPQRGYPDKVELYDMDILTGKFNCIYLGPGPSGDSSRDASVIPEP